MHESSASYRVLKCVILLTNVSKKGDFVVNDSKILLRTKLISPSLKMSHSYSNTVVKKYKSEWRAEDKASGISPNRTEADEALHDLIEQFDEADAAKQKPTAEENPKLKRSLYRHKICEIPHWKHLTRPGKRKKMIQAKVRKKDLVSQHPMILFHIFLRSMKGKFHCVKKN